MLHLTGVESAPQPSSQQDLSSQWLHHPKDAIPSVLAALRILQAHDSSDTGDPILDSGRLSSSYGQANHWEADPEYHQGYAHLLVSLSIAIHVEFLSHSSLRSS